MRTALQQIPAVFDHKAATSAVRIRYDMTRSKQKIVHGFSDLGRDRFRISLQGTLVDPYDSRVF